METTIMENQMEKNMENEMETLILAGHTAGWASAPAVEHQLCALSLVAWTGDP